MINFKDIVACTGNSKGRDFIGLSCEGGEIVVIYEDGAVYCYNVDNFELLQELVSRSKFDRIFYSHKDFSIAITDNKVGYNEKMQLILDKIDYIKNAVESNPIKFNSENAVVKNIDSLGRITIPKAIRRQFGIEDGGAARVYENDGKVIIEIIKE